mgnify:CR=1 FL=1
MKKNTLKEKFENEGYIVIKKFYDSKDCDNFLNSIRKYANEDFAPIMNPDRPEFLIPQITDIINKKKYLGDKANLIKAIEKDCKYFRSIMIDKKIKKTLEKIKKNKVHALMSQMIFKEKKTKYSKQSWLPHQDNGYEPKNKNHNNFTIFICLEDMNEKNGCLQIYPKSHNNGTLKHERVVEDDETGDNQLYVKDIPYGIKPMSIIANKGDIILFLADTLHSSLSTKTPSQRLSLITGVEEFNLLKLDNYGKLPLFIRGKLNFLEIIYLLFSKLFNHQLYWKYIKKNKMISSLIRKIIYATE